jgi:bifunctional UDP-N-acetylglucosamine pyrophosphorylase/glucosamine-1-phosphate N-acetyltransferase
MKAIILVGGEGQRLRPLTETIPKAMVRVGGKPILEYTLGILPPQITEVILVIGYRKEVITEYFGSSFGRLKISYVEQPEPKGTGEALLRARPLLDDEPFLVIYGDDLYHPDDLAACAESGLAILVREHPNPERFGVCLVDEDDRLLGILEKRPHSPTNLVNIGVYVLDKHIFDVAPIFLPNGEHNLAEQIGVMAEKHPVRAVRARFWHPIAYPEDVERAHPLIPVLLTGDDNK